MPTKHEIVSDDVLTDLDRLDDYIDWSAHFMKSEEFEPAEIALANLASFVRQVSKAETERILNSEEFAMCVVAELHDQWGEDPFFKVHTQHVVE